MRKILIIGQYKDAAMYHPFDTVDTILTKALPGFDVTCTDNIESLLDCSKFDCVISYWDDWKNQIPRNCADALIAYVKNGGSLFAIHNGISLDLRDDLKEMLGAFFVTHPAQEEIRFVPVDGTIAQTASEFTLMEEPYQFDMVADGKEIILNYIYHGQSYPAGWKKNFGRGKVAYLCPGHTSEKFANESFIKLIKSCVTWCTTYDLRDFISRIEARAISAINTADKIYDVANIVNILYTTGKLTDLDVEKAELTSKIQSFQNPDSGLFVNEGNYETHTTAFAAGALNLLDAKPKYKATGFEKYLDKAALFELMDSINWAKEPWLGAHLGAGIYGSMLMTYTADEHWEDYYFEWLDSNVDPVTGLWKKDALEGAPRFHYLASTFHYIFNYEYAKRALPYPSELLNTCIDAYRNGDCMDFATEIGWPDIDFTYMLAKACRRSGMRFEETHAILKEIADGLINQLLVLPDDKLDNLHTMFAVLCALAVLQDELPGYIKTPKPLKLVLDRRPFL